MSVRERGVDFRVFSAVGVFFAAAFLASGASAQLVISTDPTSNMNCSGGTCSPTSDQAVLNNKDLRNFLQHGNITVYHGTSRIVKVMAPVTWTKRTTLTLNGSIYIAAPIRVTGKGSLTLTTLENSQGPDISFGKSGSVTFTNAHSQLIIDALPFKPVTSLTEIIAAIQGKSDSILALVSDIDASEYGMFAQSPIGGVFDGRLEGMGHTISNLHINSVSGQDYVGLFHELALIGYVRDLNLTGAQIQSSGGSCVGVIVGDNQGMVANSFASGSLSATQALDTGGLVGCNFGSIFKSFAADTVTGNRAGGLVGWQSGLISDAMASGTVTAQPGPNTPAAGGLLGESQGGSVQTSYSTGAAVGSGALGGSIGLAFQGTYTDLYWDTTTSGNSVGCQETCNGVVGITSAKLRSGLPEGFDPATWAEDSKINRGLPYLLGAMPH